MVQRKCAASQLIALSGETAAVDNDAEYSFCDVYSQEDIAGDEPAVSR